MYTLLKREPGTNGWPWPPYRGLWDMPPMHNRVQVRNPTRKERAEVLLTSRGVKELKLFKYRDIRNPQHVQILQDLLLWIPHFASLNDPFEGQAPHRWDTESPDAKRRLREFNKWEIRQALALRSQRTEDAYADTRRTVRWLGGLSGDVLWRHKLNDYLLPSLNAFCGVSCFSREPDATLLWTHYAAGHSGFCIGFSLRRLLADFFLTTSPLRAGNVSYSDDPMEVPFDHTNHISLTQYLLTLKSRDWAYESEYRILTPAFNCAAIRLSRCSISDITFGARCDPTDMRRVSDLAMQIRPSMPVYKIAIHNGFSLARVRVS